MTAIPEQEIQNCITTFQKLGQLYRNNVKRVAGLGGAYFAAIAESKAPVGTRVHKRYSTVKANKSIRAPKGYGAVVATYQPGNLARSIQVLRLRRTKSAVYVGAVLAKGGAKGNFSGMRADGYYMHMVEQGTRKWSGHPFFRRAWESSKQTVENIMIKEFQRIGAQFERENAI